MERLDTVVRASLELEPDVDVRSTSYRHTTAWDSVAHLQLLTALEEEFEITFDDEDVLDMTAYDQLREAVERRLRAKRLDES